MFRPERPVTEAEPSGIIRPERPDFLGFAPAVSTTAGFTASAGRGTAAAGVCAGGGLELHKGLASFEDGFVLEVELAPEISDHCEFALLEAQSLKAGRYVRVRHRVRPSLLQFVHQFRADRREPFGVGGRSVHLMSGLFP
ncbi:hypothetical protein C4F17_07175 [Variovorax sp. PMC12]|nr:hypothetical protein C4F17_07175 [Variovorax sp. PMC12]